MSGHGISSNEIHQSARQALHDPRLQEAYRSSTLRLYTHRLAAVDEVPGFQQLRQRAHELKREVIENLDYYLLQFAENAKRQGGKIHWAATAEEACSIVESITASAGARELIKAKTMVSEEIELNRALEEKGIRPFETDLGEFIVQMTGDPATMFPNCSHAISTPHPPRSPRNLRPLPATRCARNSPAHRWD